MTPRLRGLNWSFVIALALAGPLRAQVTTPPSIIRAERITGAARTDSGRAVPGAEVIATMAPDREIFRTTTDSLGRFDLRIEKGTGDYLLYIGSPDRVAFRRRLTRRGDDSVFTVDAQLAARVQNLAPVRTVATRPRPTRGVDQMNDPGASGGVTMSFGGVPGALSPDQMGDINAMALTIPGLALTPEGGISAFGLDASQNLVTLNGMSFGGSSLPRDLQMTVRVYSSLYDPTAGNFAGSLIALEIAPGSLLGNLGAHFAFDLPQLQFGDRATAPLGQRFARGDISLRSSGELVQDTWSYNGALQVSFRQSDAPTILDRNAAAFSRLGIADDSAAKFLTTMSTLGLLTAGTKIPSAFTSRSVAAAFRLDRAGLSMFGGPPPTDLRPRWGVIGSMRYSDDVAFGASPSALASHSGERNGIIGSLQLNHSRYLDKDQYHLNETRLGVSVNHSATTPYLSVPDGRVLVTSTPPSGIQGISSMQFGGNSGLDASNTQWTAEGTNEFSWYPRAHPSHRLKLYANGQIDHLDQSSVANRFGSYGYNSLADLQSNAPSSFSRTLFAPDRVGGNWSTSFALADYVTKFKTGGQASERRNDFSMVFGPRVDLNGWTSAPSYNPAVEQAFGRRNDAAPVMVHVSPRFGFTLYRRGRLNSQIGLASSRLGTLNFVPRGVLSGGFGEFRTRPSASVIADAAASTGLPGETTARLTCLGSAVPAPDWSGFLSGTTPVPSACAGGAPAAYSDVAPSVRLIDPAYDAARTWRGNLSWSSSIRSTTYKIDASYSRNIKQPGFVDLNFGGTTRFTLPQEANRPVYVNAASIVPSSGLVTGSDARVSQQFGRVLDQVSDLTSDTRQVTLFVQPYLPRAFSRWVLRGSYTFADSRSQSRGFTGTTAGDPRVIERSTGYFPKHQFTWQTGRSIAKLKTAITFGGSFASGFPFTPTVAGDINGDGSSSDDRAFVVSPNSSGANAVAMRDLLDRLPARVEDCLTRQFNQIAAPNSCRGPWRATMNARADFYGRLPGVNRNMSASLNLANPLTGLDLLLHGPGNLRGWGGAAFPHQALYYVRGFDPAARAYTYEVNPRFGQSRPATTAITNPFRLTLDLTLDLRGNGNLKMAQMLVRAPRGSGLHRATPDTILRRMRANGTAPNWAAGILFLSDSLLLTEAQQNALRSLGARAQAANDSALRAGAAELSAMPLSAPADSVQAKMNRVNQCIFQSAARSEPAIKAILTPRQIRLLGDNTLRSMPGLLRDTPTKLPEGCSPY